MVWRPLSIWPDAQPWDEILFVIMAVIVVWLNRLTMSAVRSLEYAIEPGKMGLSGGDSVTIEELERELLKLVPGERAKIAEKLLRSLEALSDEENERLWAEEALKRHTELDTGAASGRSADEVLHHARKRLS